MTGISLLLFAAALMIGVFRQEPIAGYPAGEAASALAYGAVGILLTGWALEQFRGRWTNALQALAVWAVLIVGLAGIYSYRLEFQDVAVRVLGDIVPGEPAVTKGGEVTITRRMDGSFIVAARGNEQDLRLIFDTGATTVVLTADTATRLGFHPDKLTFRVPVATANGRTMTAPVTIDRLAIGSIAMTKVKALVAQPGTLHENLLGMTFLDRLASYEVRGNKLFLRGTL